MIGLVSIFHYMFNEQGTMSRSGEHHMNESPFNRGARSFVDAHCPSTEESYTQTFVDWC